LPTIDPKEIGEKLTYYGLETKVIQRENDIYFEFDILPNRPDLLSWWGIVQEIGIILNCQVKPVNPPIINEAKVIEVVINTSACSEFCLGLIKNIEVKKSPDWIKEWLAVNNIRSINNVVDSANLVMLESGQPLHIFDYDTLPEKKIMVRQAQQGEKVNALHGQELELSSGDIVISSGKKIISLGGVIGSQETAVTPQTKNILIECASFDPQTIKKTTKRLNISTATSHFFSRRANLVLSPRQILARVISYLVETYQGDVNSGTIFSYQKVEKTRPIVAISQEFITKKVGQVLSEQTTENLWQQLKFPYQKEGEFYYVTVPLWRPDITSPEDLLEELLRIYGYHKVSGSLP